MKKIFYILAGVLLCATACQREAFDEGNGRSTTEAPGPGDVALLDFTVDYPEAGLGTRATMGEANLPSTLYIAVFSYEGGYLQNWIPATLVKPAKDPANAGMKVTYEYKAYLPINTNEIFHFIGDTPIENPTFANEDEFIKSFVTENKEGAFWQRVVVKGGIVAKKNADGSFDLDDNGNYKIDLNANGYNEDNPNPLRHVVMVRNFAKIEVTSADAHFDVVQWALVNVPKYGTVAPWSARESGDVVGFHVAYTSIKDYLPEVEGGTGKKKLGTFYDDLTQKDDSGYKGYYGTVPTVVNGVEVAPADLIDQTEPTTFVQSGSDDPGLYMYERPLPNLERNQPPTMILIQVRWNSKPEGSDIPDIGEGETLDYWYLIELLDDQGEYMPFLRNIKYKFHLSGIDEKGEASASAAFRGKVLGNVSTSLETSTLNELLVGNHKIVVANMDYAFFNEKQESSSLEFQYFPNISGDPVFNSSADGVDETEKVHINIMLKTVAGYEPAIRSLSTIDPDEDNPEIVTKLTGVPDEAVYAHDDGSNWGAIPYTMNSSGTEMKKSIIRVQGSYGTGLPIFRDVVVTVMAKPDFDKSKTSVSELTSDSSGQPVTVTIGLPSGLGSSLFPIQVRIEAENNCLSTTSSILPVKDDISTFNGVIPAHGDQPEIPAESTQAGKRTFYYIRTIKYSEYYHPTADEPYTYEFPCVFTTTKTSKNAPTKIKLSDGNDRFNPVILELKVGSGS